MLEALRIANYAIIDQLEVEFNPAFTVITGETGAGKSILLGAFKVLLGDRATADMIRTDCTRASIEGIFTRLSDEVNRWLDENGLTSDDPDSADTLLLRRDLLAGGTSRNFINGSSATATQLRALGMMLVDMHGQNEHSRLNSAAAQLEVLDNFGSYDRELNAYRAAYETWREVRQRFDELSTEQGDAERRKDFLEFQVQEIEQAELSPGEDIELEAERRRLANAERLREVCSQVRDMLYEGEVNENPAGVQVGQAARLLQELGILDPDQAGLAQEAESIRFALEDLSEKIRDYMDRVAGDPERLDHVETRLELIRGLKRKYGASVEEVLATYEKLSAELSDIVNHDQALADAEESLARVEADASAAARKLSAARRKAAMEFEKQVQTAMRELELPKAVLKINLVEAHSGNVSADDKRPQFSASGQDHCEFMVSLNAGEALKPMRKVASGGEVSRIMLAIKSVLAKRDQVPTLVFDEIDTGISGEAAARVGERLEKLAASHQVICITHLPQVAARGTMHLVVEKAAKKNRTSTTVTPVEGEARTMALARMLSGEQVDETTRQFAQKLLVR